MSAPIEQGDTPSQRIAKLLPADITAALLSVKGAVSATVLSQAWIVYGGIAIGVLAPFYFYLVVRTTNVRHIVFLMLSYVIFFISIAPIELGNVFMSARTVFSAINVVGTPIWIFIVTPIIANVLGEKLDS